jgi:hypothetical protein
VSFPYDDRPSFTLHEARILWDAEGSIDDRLIIDATAPDGIRRQLSIRTWHEDLINGHYEDAWRLMGAKMLRIAHRVDTARLIEGAKRDHGFLQI